MYGLASVLIANMHVQASTTTMIMEPYEPYALMRFTATMSLNGLSSKGDTHIDTVASLNLFQ